MTEITIREAVPADAESIAAICGSSLGYECTDELVQSRLAALDSRRECVFAAVKDGSVIGFVHAELYVTLYFDKLVNILGIAVANGFKRCGAGRKLMSACEDWAREKGAVGVRLNSGAGRTNAHKFYRAIGFDDEKMQVRFIKNV